SLWPTLSFKIRSTAWKIVSGWSFSANSDRRDCSCCMAISFISRNHVMWKECAYGRKDDPRTPCGGLSQLFSRHHARRLHHTNKHKQMVHAGRVSERTGASVLR